MTLSPLQNHTGYLNHIYGGIRSFKPRKVLAPDNEFHMVSAWCSPVSINLPQSRSKPESTFSKNKDRLKKFGDNKKSIPKVKVPKATYLYQRHQRRQLLPQISPEGNSQIHDYSNTKRRHLLNTTRQVEKDAIANLSSLHSNSVEMTSPYYAI